MCTTTKMKILVVLFLITFVGCYKSIHPSDKELEDRFSFNKLAFINLAEMFNEDSSVTLISLEEIEYQDNSDSKISNERLKAYRNFLQEIEIVTGIYRTYDGGIGLGISAKDSVWFGGSAKGYLFSTNKKKPIVDSLDNLEGQYDFEGIRYRKLEKNWYIVYSEW